MEDKIGIYSIIFFAVFFLFFGGIILLFMQYKNKQKEAIKEKKIITLKGRIVGYDDIMEEIKLDQCIVIKNKN